MTAYLLRRLAAGFFIVWGVYTLTFLAVNLAPGDPFQNLENPKMQKEDLDRLRSAWGYDLPVHQRYFLHLRKMFWADRETLAYEADGFLFDVFPHGTGNGISATLQSPPPEILLAPDSTSRSEQKAVEVRLARRPDGTYEARPMGRGRYKVGRTHLIVSETPTTVETDGVRIQFEAGRIRAEPIRTDAPSKVLLVGDGGTSFEIPLGQRVAASPDRYRLKNVDILVPPDRLQDSGLTFDLGTSVLNKQPVVSYLARPLWNTLLLAVAAIFIDFLVGIIIGVISATRQNSKLDHAITIGALFVYSMPGFWLGLMLMLIFSVHLQWLPAEGMHSVGQSGIWDLLRHMIMPALVLGIGPAAATARYQRSALLEVIEQDYIRTARAKGLSENVVIWKHAMANSLLPVITLFGLTLPFLVSGSVIVEKIFSWPGMGREVIKAIDGRDVFVISGITLIATSMVVVGNMIADILYAVVDPRVRLK